MAKRRPKVGDRLVFESVQYEVTDYSSYKNDEGYRVDEWCCETDQNECYLLKEYYNREEFRWFFTRWVKTSRVRLPDRQRFQEIDWKDGTPPPEPPKTLVLDDIRCDYDSTTDGQYEDEPGEKVRKLTWDYWDTAKQHNLAVEVWGNGGMDCYYGRYIDDSAVRFKNLPAKRHRSSSGAGEAGPLGCFTGVLALGLFIGLFAAAGGIGYDSCMSVALALALAFAWLILARLPAVYHATALGAAALEAALIGRFPPLSSWIGLPALLAVPAALACVANTRPEAPEERPRVRALATVAAALPPFAWGLVRYYSYAPVPHGFGQYCSAQLPALVGAAAAWLLLGWFIQSRGEDVERLG